jgi:hypothetical protein
VLGVGGEPDERSRLVAAEFVGNRAAQHQVGFAAGVAVAREGVRRRAIGDPVEHQGSGSLPGQLAQLDTLAKASPLEGVKRRVVDLEAQEVAQIAAEAQSFTS